MPHLSKCGFFILVAKGFFVLWNLLWPLIAKKDALLFLPIL